MHSHCNRLHSNIHNETRICFQISKSVSAIQFCFSYSLFIIACLCYSNFVIRICYLILLSAFWSFVFFRTMFFSSFSLFVFFGKRSVLQSVLHRSFDGTSYYWLRRVFKSLLFAAFSSFFLFFGARSLKILLCEYQQVHY